ncbi:hypothetical protein AMS68_005246 [Peltaster fructicola]|uniref:Importin N-terminal domain-containing protein n=1 Tax=Peltaster fructicola TaxID=286661 RepID=A0A6H0XYN2_9PEZI|nr:hypothetical protein AMS68_005246 [Peltaster fructicola]
MEQQLVSLLNDTQSPADTTRKNAEWQLKQQYANPDFPTGLMSIASHTDVPVQTRQSALLVLKNFVLACWSAAFEEFSEQSFADEGRKSQIRHSLLNLALSEHDERKVKSLASLVVSKIATADFPDEWPDLLPTVLGVLASGSDGQLHGALKVLNELVDDCFNQDQFFQVARDLVQAVYNIAVDTNRKPILRALAVSVFRANFDILEMVMEDNKAAVKGFAEEILSSWIPFLTETLKTALPAAPTSGDPSAAEFQRGSVAFKLQVVKVLIRIRTLFSSLLSAHSTALFSATFSELSVLRAQYHDSYIQDDLQSRLQDADGLPYSLDLLVLEELDFLQACLRAPPVRKELEQQTQAAAGTTPSWLLEIMRVAVAYAQITMEEEGLWDIDVNVFLSEETNVTANYTPRTACGDLVIKLGEWMNTKTIEALLTYTRSLYNETSTWKLKESSLYLLNQLLSDFQDMDKEVGSDSANGYVDLVKHSMQQEEIFLRARGYLVAGSLVRTSGGAMTEVAASFLEMSLHAIHNDPSEVVKVSCIRALSYYMAALPALVSSQMQPVIVAALVHFVDTQDLGDPDESDDLLITIIEALRDAILINTHTCLGNGGVDLLFTLASRGASNFQVALLVTETFEEIASTIAGSGHEPYAQLSSKVLPSLMGAFDVASLTEENALANLAAELLSVLAAEGLSPLPNDFVKFSMPRLHRLLLGSKDEELLKAATSAVKHILSHDPEQVFAWHDDSGKSGLEVVLTIIDRLLDPAVDDNSASEVGGLAAEVVEKAGSERLGPYLPQLLRAVAARLAIATQAQSIQSLILVFARLSLTSASDVVTFLSEVQISEQNGLQVVMSQWLENSVNFAGYDEIRQNVTALSRLYDLQDPRLIALQVKGDLIVRDSGRIMTRSRARQQPDEYTSVSAQIKIIKVLVEELLSASGSRTIDASATNGDKDDGSEDSEWEDDPDDFLDLGTGMTKSQLMALGQDDAPTRDRDDETQAYLLDFFKQAATKPEFAETFAALTSAEQEKLQSMSY